MSEREKVCVCMRVCVRDVNSYPVSRPNDFPYDTQAFQVIFTQGPGSSGNYDIDVVPVTEHDVRFFFCFF